MFFEFDLELGIWVFKKRKEKGFFSRVSPCRRRRSSSMYDSRHGGASLDSGFEGGFLGFFCVHDEHNEHV